MAESFKSQWTQDPREALRVRPGFKLAEFDRGSKPAWDGNKAEATATMEARGALLPELQERLFAEGRSGGTRSVLCVLQGLDTAGKGGVVRHVMGFVDPQGIALRSFGVPTAEERKHDYLWRIRNSLPTPGKIGVFDRSHYEDVLVVRVNEIVPKEVWEKRYDEINQFEKEVVDSGTTILKFGMMVSHQEQGMRLMERLDRPDKWWKYNPSDLETRSHWDDFQEAYQAVFDLTNTDYAPWYVIPCDNKWYPHLAITEILTRTLIEMNLGWPQAEWDVKDQRAQLSATMSTASLIESYEGTEAAVRKGIDESLEVRRDSSEILGGDSTVGIKRRDAKKAVLESQLAETLEQKKQLIAERDDAPSAETTSKKKNGKGDKNGK